jgi:CRP-like cAMP-binding protein
VVDQLAQTAACNRLHHVKERLARWLLIAHDYAGADEIPMTHEFIAMMLGIRRSGVTTAIGALTIDGVIEHGRNKITIRKRHALEAVSCECYAAVRAELDRSLGIRR